MADMKKHTTASA